jgi:hypothetical protein
VTAKEKLMRDVLDLDEAKAARARIVVLDDAEAEPEMVPLPEGWGKNPHRLQLRYAARVKKTERGCSPLTQASWSSYRSTAPERKRALPSAVGRN